MKMFARIAVLVVLVVSALWGQHPPNCDAGCGGGSPPVPGSGGSPMLTSTSFTNARGTGSSLLATQRVGKSTVIEGSQSYTYAVNLFSLPGRNGLNLNLTLYYNSLVWEFNSDNNSMVYGADFDSPSPGFRLDYGLLQFATDLSLGVLTEPNGAKHLFVPTGTASQYATQDSSYILVQYPATSGNPVVVTYKNGLRVFYQLFDTIYQYQYRPYQIEDTNGNIIAITYLNSNSLGINTITDTVGRVIQFTYDSTGKMLQSVAQLNSSGQVFRQYSFGWDQNRVITFNFTTPQATAGLGLPPGNLTSGQSTENLLTKVTRPDGTAVVFDYVHDFTLGFVDNPDWGIVKNIQEQSSNGAIRYNTHYTFPAANAGALTSNPTYTQQVVDDGVQSSVWNFQATKNANGLVTCFATLDPLGRLTTTTFSSNGTSTDGLPAQDRTSSISPGTSFSGCQTSVAQTWRTINHSWTTDPDGSNARSASITTVLEDNTTQSQIKFNSYDSFGQVTDLLEYDFGAGQPGPLLREAVTTYAALANNIVTRLSEIKIKDGGGNVVSDTKFNYDETPVSSVNSLPSGGTHDETNYSASSTNARGNLTSAIHYANAAAGTGAISSTFTHDELGNTLTSSTGSGPQTFQAFSSITQYAYPDSVSIGQQQQIFSSFALSGGQLTTSYTYDMDRRTVASVTDPNGQTTTFTADIDSRPNTATGPDGMITTTSYDDAGQHAAVSVSSTANSLEAKIISDGIGHPLSRQILNGTSLISTTAFTNNVAGQVLQATNPYAPTDSIVNTTYTYDPPGRALTVTPPAISSAPQNPYQTQYAPGTFTDLAGNQRSGQIVTTTDPAGKQRRQYIDALGRLVRVDEPGPTGGQAGGSGSVSISGTEQSVSVANGGGATAGTGSVTFAGTERSTVVRTHNATSASINVTIGGADNTNFFTTCIPRHPCISHQSPDAGTIQFSVTIAGTTVGPVQVNYDGSSTTTSIAAALYAAFPSNSLVTMSNPNGSSSFTLTTTATGSATNSASFTDALTSGCDPTSEYVACRGVGWTMTLSGPNLSPTTAASASLTGGSDNIDTTFYDTGTVTVNITIGGMGYSKTSTYGQSSTVAGIASDLANQINSDTTLNQKLVASSTSNVLNLTTTATGANTADPLSVTGGTSSQYFASGSSSFTATPSGSTLTPGQNGVVFDAGTVTVSIAGFTATPRNYTANYSQGSSASTVASAIAGAINGDSIAPVTANVTNGSNVVTLTSKTLGSDTNYGVTATSATSQGTYFTQASFSGSGTALSGGTDSTASLSTPLSTFYGYNALGNLLAVTQGQQIRRYQYDSLGRMTSACLPELSNQCTTYTYTDFGAMATKADPRSITTTYGYGTLGRLLTVTYSDGTPGVTYTYGAAGSGNGAGRLASVNTSSTADAYTYDNMGRVTQCVKTIAGQNYTTSYHYSNGQLDYLTYPSGRVVYQDHDAIGRLSQIRSSGLTLFSVGSFNAGGEILSSTYGNGMTGSYTYNNQMQLASLQTSNSGVAVLNLVYSYGGANDNGQISGITDGVNSARSTSYLYDELGRLKIAQTTDLTSANTWKLKFSYDRYGNRLSEVPVAGTASMPMNEMVADPATNRLTNLAYDADGNVTNDGLHAYAYNALNHITNVDGASNTYAYDARGLRVNKNGTVYIYSSGRPIAEYASGAAANSPKVEYGYFRGQLVASVASGVLTYYYGDHLSTRVQADGSGTVTRTFGLFPFGETWYETGTPNEWKFTTYERDSESGLDYAKARYDSIQLGRFTSLDLLAGNGGDPQSRNRYTYVTNDPINLSDPTGLNSSKWDMCVYDDKGDPAQCFALPGASKELTDAEALFGVFEMLSKLDCSAHCEIQIGPDTSLDFINALNLAAGFLPNLEIVQVGISDSARGVDNFWTCFAGLSCNPVEKFMQPIVSRDLGPLNIPSLPRPKAGVPPPETPVPNFGRRVDPLSGHQVDQLEPIPPELLVAPGISVRW